MLDTKMSLFWSRSAQFLLVILWILSWNIRVSADCVWYGECSTSNTSGYPINCPYSGPPKLLKNTTAQKMLLEICPYYHEHKGPLLTCCDEKQINSVHTHYGMALVKNLIGRCPGCYYNFRLYHCLMMCSPQQSQFLRVLSLVDDPVTLKKAISSVQLFVEHASANALFNSCSDVSFTGLYSVTLLCEVPEREQCSGKIWVETMGKSSYSPFPIDVIVSNDTTVTKEGLEYMPMKLDTIFCDKPAFVDGPACTCGDCQASCKNLTPPFDLPEPEVSARFMVGDYDGMLIVACLTYIVLIVLFFAGLLVRGFYRFRTRRREILQAGADPAVGNFDARDKAQQTTGYSEQASVLEPVKTRYKSCAFNCEDLIERFFTRWGIFCASHPFTVIVIGLIISGGLSCGLISFSVTTDPIELWAMPGSRARLETEYFNNHFQPFMRTEQVIIVPKVQDPFRVHNQTYSNIFKRDILLEVLALQTKIESLAVRIGNRSITLVDICTKPMTPANNNCLTMSIVDMFSDKKKLNDIKFEYLTHLTNCINAHLAPECFGPYGGPILPFVALGGFTDNEYLTAKVLVLTFSVNNYVNKSDNSNALAWEHRFLDFMASYKRPDMHFYYSAARSIEDEFDRESKSDIVTVGISYLIMFVYISVSLGQLTGFKRLLTDSKITLGICGISIVILSVTTSIGLFSFLNVPATLIVVEVVPFMVLAVGVDNIFILTRAYQRDERQENETREEQIGRVVGDVAPSMMLSSVTDAAGFFLGALSTMPAVRTFALYAGVALIVAFMLQITCFVSAFSLDARRHEANRLDVCCCVNSERRHNPGLSPGIIYTIFKRFYAPFLMSPVVRFAVMILFPLWFCTSLAVVNKLNIGLEQELAAAKNSYLSNYLTALKENLAVGPPVYFVIKSGYNYSNWRMQNAVCHGAVCDSHSIMNQISFARHNSESTFIAQDAFSWVDDYTSWITKKDPACCRVNETSHTFCPSVDHECAECEVEILDVGGFKHVFGHSFDHFLPAYLQDNPNVKDGCIGGHPQYGTNVEILKNGNIGATAFMSFHTILKTSKDYYEALWYARYISDRLTNYLNHNFGKGKQKYEVFAYSIFYVFYEQYLTIWQDTMLNLLYIFVCIYIISFLLLGMDFVLSLIIVAGIFMIVMNLMGIMYWWNIQLNAVSLVNLVVAVGIAVEFVSHITRAFAISQAETNMLRSKDALINMGSSVLAGVTLTKFTGICVLGFSNSQIFKVFYFRINLCIVLFGAAHGLIFVPVLLSFFGPPANKRKLYMLTKRALKRSWSVKPSLTATKALARTVSTLDGANCFCFREHIAAKFDKPLSFSFIDLFPRFLEKTARFLHN